MQFHYGQRVRCVKPVDGNRWIVGQVGTICAMGISGKKPSVLFDNAGKPGNPELHGARCDDGSTISIGVWNCNIDALVPLDLHTTIGVEDLI